MPRAQANSNAPSAKQATPEDVVVPKKEEPDCQASKVESQSCRPKRKATNVHAFRYLQTRNPTRLEENDLKRALVASLEECPDFWPEETASCSSSEQSSATTFSSGRSSSNSNQTTSSSSKQTRRQPKNACCCCNRQQLSHQTRAKRGRANSSASQTNHLRCNHPNQFTANHNCCPMSSVHNRYKPVAKKNIYNEADFFHDGIMEYIEYELGQTLYKAKKQILQPKQPQQK